MSRAIGMGSTQFMGARVAGDLTYIPAHNRNGVPIQAKVVIPVYINSGKRKDGSDGRKDQFKITTWGKMADICAKSLSRGKAFDCICTPNSYKGRIYDAQGNLRVDNTGQAITVEKVGFTMDKAPIFGEESQKEVDKEIQEGRRPQHWNNPAHADYQLYQNILTNRRAVTYNGGNKFGYARVTPATGNGVTQANVAPATNGQQTVAATTAPDTTKESLLSMIREVLNEQTPPPVVPNTVPTTYNAANNDMPF